LPDSRLIWREKRNRNLFNWRKKQEKKSFNKEKKKEGKDTLVLIE